MFDGSVASTDLAEVVSALKGAAEPTRLRLLALLSHGELTVGEIGDILGQSQPRISRHLRVLTEAGFLSRFREQQRVYYRTPVKGRQLEWLRLVLAMLDPEAPALRRDRERVTRVITERVQAQDPRQNTTDLAAVLNEEIGPAGLGELLDIGTGTGLMLEILGPRAQHAVGVDISAQALRFARARARGAGFSHCEFRHGDMYGLPYESASFDTITIDRVLAEAQRPEAAIAEAARTLRPQGRLVIVEDFEQMSARADGNPLLQLRRWLAQAGMETARLHPCDMADRHFVVAFASHKTATRNDPA